MGCFFSVDGLGADLVPEDTGDALSIQQGDDGAFRADQKMSIVLKDDLYRTGAGYTVTDLDGAELFKLTKQGSGLSINDMNGQTVAMLHSKTEGIGGFKETTFYLKDSSQRDIAVMTQEPSFGIFRFAVRSPDTSRSVYYNVAGKFHGHQFVTRNQHNQIVSKSAQSFLANSKQYEKKSYAVEICKGCDFVVMTMVNIALDEFNLQNGTSPSV